MATFAAGQAERVRHLGDLLVRVGQELVQRRVEEADRYGQALHRPQDAREIGALHGENLRKGAASPLLVVGEDHLADGEDAVRLEEHVLRATEADALGTEFAPDGGVRRVIGVRAHAEMAHLVGPVHDGREVGVDLAGRDRHDAEHYVARRTVDADHVAGPDRNLAPLEVDLEQVVLVVDLQSAAAAYAAAAHATRHDGGVRRHAAPRREHAGGGLHAVDVLRRGLDADEDHGLA